VRKQLDAAAAAGFRFGPKETPVKKNDFAFPTYEEVL